MIIMDIVLSSLIHDSQRPTKKNTPLPDSYRQTQG